jgi:NADPH-dependent ferric siderophore reductase
MTAGFEVGCVSATRLLAPRIKHITVTADSLAGLSLEPGADVAIRFPGEDGELEERRYSVWKSGAQAGALDVCVVLHGRGPGSWWAERCAAGDRIEISCSRTLPISLDRRAAAHLFLGDETSIAATEAMLGLLSAEVPVLSCFEIASLEHRWPDAELVRPRQVHWVERSGRPGTALLTWLTRQSLTPPMTTTSYVTGEAWLCALVQRHLVRERGFDLAAVRAMPYWRERMKVP